MRLGALSGLMVAALVSLAACGGGADQVEDTTTDAAVQGRPETPEVEVMRPAGPTLTSIRSRGHLNCGIHPGLVGFSYTDNRGRWRGFDIDFCRATAAAVLGDPNAVRFVPVTNDQRFPALEEGRVDVLWRNTSRTLSRDGSGFDFPGTNYFDGQGFLVRRNLDLTSATELNGARVCVQAGSTSELNVADWFRVHGLTYTPVIVASETAARTAYAREDCDALTADVSALAAARTTLSDPRAHVILPDVISREPLGPAVREGDDQWADIVRWTLNALILAEALDVTQENIDQMVEETRNPEIRRLLGVEGHVGRPLGLNDTWARQAISAAGNYGEIFERNVGTESALDLSRGLNALWTAQPAGLMYAAPIR